MKFHKPLRRPDLQASFEVDKDIYTSDTSRSNSANMIWVISRLDTNSDVCNPYPIHQEMPAWSATNSIWTKEIVPCKQVAFLPVLPYPSTRFDTVYTQLKSYVSIVSQLVQNSMPVYFDEKVYAIAKEIQLICPDEFKCLFLCLGSFHTMKTLMKALSDLMLKHVSLSMFLDQIVLRIFD